MANKTTLRERIATLEEAVKTGFLNINEKFDNHLSEHKEKDRFSRRLIIALIAIIGAFCIKLFF